jgi:hypothetical protein
MQLTSHKRRCVFIIITIIIIIIPNSGSNSDYSWPTWHNPVQTLCILSGFRFSFPLCSTVSYFNFCWCIPVSSLSVFFPFFWLIASLPSLILFLLAFIHLLLFHYYQYTSYFLQHFSPYVYLDIREREEQDNGQNNTMRRFVICTLHKIWLP